MKSEKDIFIEGWEQFYINIPDNAKNDYNYSFSPSAYEALINANKGLLESDPCFNCPNNKPNQINICNCTLPHINTITN